MSAIRSQKSVRHQVWELVDWEGGLDLGTKLRQHCQQLMLKVEALAQEWATCVRPLRLY